MKKELTTLVLFVLLASVKTVFGQAECPPPRYGPGEQTSVDCPWEPERWQAEGYNFDAPAPGSLSAVGVTNANQNLSAGEVDGLTMYTISETMFDLYDGTSYIMRVDANNEASTSAFFDYINSARIGKEGVIQDLWWAIKAGGASRACNIATVEVTARVAFNLICAFERSVPCLAVNMIETARAYNDMWSKCVR